MNNTRHYIKRKEEHFRAELKEARADKVRNRRLIEALEEAIKALVSVSVLLLLDTGLLDDE